MAAAAIFTRRQADILRHFRPLDRLLAFKHYRAGFIASGGWCFVIGAGAVVTDYAINIVLIVKVKTFILPAVTGVTLRTHAFITTGIGTKIIDQIFFSKELACFFVFISPGPVYVLHELMTGFSVTLQAGFGYLGATGEGSL